MKRKNYSPIVLALAFLLLVCEAGWAEDSSKFIDVLSLEMLDEAGHTTKLEDYADYTRLVFFGFTSCLHICPMTLSNVRIALNSLGPVADEVRVIFISVDPKRDTPEVLARYTDTFHSSIVGFTGTYDQITAMTAGFRTTFSYSMKIDGKVRPLTREEYQKLEPTASYVPAHGSQIYLLNKNGEVADVIGYGSTAADMEATLRSHLASH
jgi:protein SCO1/2